MHYTVMLYIPTFLKVKPLVGYLWKLQKQVQNRFVRNLFQWS